MTRIEESFDFSLTLQRKQVKPIVWGKKGTRVGKITLFPLMLLHLHVESCLRVNKTL